MPKPLLPTRSGAKMVETFRGEVPAGRNDREYNQYLEKLHILKQDVLGDVVRGALAASSDGRFRVFLELTKQISTPRGKWPPKSLAACANQAQIELMEFKAFWRDARTNEAIDLATDALPGLTKDLIDDAKSDENTCPMCDGTGQVQREGKPDKICPNCVGKGMIRTIGDKHARDRLIEMTGAIKKEPIVQVNLNTRGLGMESAATRLNKAVPFDLDITAEPVDSGSDPK